MGRVTARRRVQHVTADDAGRFAQANRLQRLWADLETAGRHTVLNSGIAREECGRARMDIDECAHGLRRLADTAHFSAILYRPLTMKVLRWILVKVLDELRGWVVQPWSVVRRSPRRCYPAALSVGPPPAPRGACSRVAFSATTAGRLLFRSVRPEQQCVPRAQSAYIFRALTGHMGPLQESQQHRRHDHADNDWRVLVSAREIDIRVRDFGGASREIRSLRQRLQPHADVRAYRAGADDLAER
jgi:hypothetical protein